MEEKREMVSQMRRSRVERKGFSAALSPGLAKMAAPGLCAVILELFFSKTCRENISPKNASI